MKLRYVRPHGSHAAGDVVDVDVPDGAVFADYLELAEADPAPAAVTPAAAAASKDGS